MKHVFVVEEHFVNCGLGSIMSREYIKSSLRWRLFTLGISSKFIHEIKDQAGMREYFGISGAKIAKFIKSKIKKD